MLKNLILHVNTYIENYKEGINIMKKYILLYLISNDYKKDFDD